MNLKQYLVDRAQQIEEALLSYMPKLPRKWSNWELLCVIACLPGARG